MLYLYNIESTDYADFHRLKKGLTTDYLDLHGLEKMTDERTYKIIGAAMTALKELGCY